MDQEPTPLRAWPERIKDKMANRGKLLASLRSRFEKGEITAEEYQVELLALQRQARAGKL